MTMLRPESEMKDSGIEWIGKMPFNWELHRIRNNYRIITGNGFKPELQGRDSGKYPVCKASDISSAGSTLFSAVNYIDETIASEEHFNIIPANSIIFPKIGEAMKKNNRTRVLVDCCVDNNCQGLVPQVINPVYSYYLLSCIDMRWFDNAGTIPSLNNQKLKDCKIPYPSLAEQQAIALYLDDCCSKLDEIITEAEKSIEEYKELKQAVIFEAVTKGLDRNAPMKDSGMEFVDKIPETWQVVRFIRTNWVRGRLGWKGLKADEYVDEGYPFLSAFNIINSHLSWDDVNHITQERYDESPEIKLSIGDIVLVKDGAGIGKCARIDELPLGAATVNSSLAVITPQENIYYKYEYYYFLSPLFQNIIARLRNGMGVPHLTQESMKAIYIPLPSIEEQKEISVYLDTRVNELDALISEKQSLIEDLKAYKKSLIYEVVTGKRRVV